MNAPVYVDIDQGIYKVKLKVALNEKRKKLRGFSFSINMANFEAFCRTNTLISNPFFLKSFQVIPHISTTLYNIFTFMYCMYFWVFYRPIFLSDLGWNSITFFMFVEWNIYHKLGPICLFIIIKKIKFLMCLPVFISFVMIVRKWEFLMHYEVRMKNLTKCEKVSLSDVLTLLWNVRKAPRARSCAIDFQTKILLGLNKILKFPVHFQIFI